jgi:hypothetical protein
MRLLRQLQVAGRRRVDFHIRRNAQVEGVGKHVSAFAASKEISVVRDSTDSADRQSKLDVSLDPRTGIAPVNSREV